jgi:hypothetical protein
MERQMNVINESADFFAMYKSDSKNYLLNHFKSLQQANLKYNAELIINANNMHLELIHKNKKHILYPQFLEFMHGNPVYSSHLTPDAICFIGWRPYQPYPIQAFVDKIIFKESLLKNKFLTPLYSVDKFCKLDHVIIKNRQGSFNQSLYGPYQSATEYPLNPESGEFFEQFIYGKILKISFWNDEPVSLEEQEMPTLTGDGESSILKLAAERAKKRNRNINEFKLDEVVSFYGKSTEDVLAKKEVIIADFRYESEFCECYAVKEIPLPNKSYQIFDVEFKRVGAFCYHLIKAEGIENLYYSIDAILSDNNQLWFLEANANPAVHPCAYTKILESLL